MKLYFKDLCVFFCVRDSACEWGRRGEDNLSRLCEPESSGVQSHNNEIIT